MPLLGGSSRLFAEYIELCDLGTFLDVNMIHYATIWVILVRDELPPKPVREVAVHFFGVKVTGMEAFLELVLKNLLRLTSYSTLRSSNSSQ